MCEHIFDELSNLASLLNRNSDQLNSLIASLNSKLAKLNLGVEVWLDDCPLKVEEKRKAYLGYAEIKGEWQLSVRDGDCLFVSVTRMNQYTFSLLSMSREARLLAMPLMPLLLKRIKSRIEELLKGLDNAREAADALVADHRPSAVTIRLREFARLRDGAIAGTGAIMQYTVDGLPEGQEASIANKGSRSLPRWEILRRVNGVQGDWTGRYETPTHALCALQDLVNRGL